MLANRGRIQDIYSLTYFFYTRIMLYTSHTASIHVGRMSTDTGYIFTSVHLFSIKLYPSNTSLVHVGWLRKRHIIYEEFFSKRR